VWREALKPTLEKFSPYPKIGGKLKNFANRRQSEACNFETVQQIDKQVTDVSSTINVLKRYQTWRHHLTGF